MDANTAGVDVRHGFQSQQEPGLVGAELSRLAERRLKEAGELGKLHGRGQRSELRGRDQRVSLAERSMGLAGQGMALWVEVVGLTG